MHLVLKAAILVSLEVENRGLAPFQLASSTGVELGEVKLREGIVLLVMIEIQAMLEHVREDDQPAIEDVSAEFFLI